ncbi:MAG: hypothetical protein LUK37_24760 [Clostridia bacterium]|nr:hypothetical protein [Clostridia bacterium]
MKTFKCPICQRELERDTIQCPYCKYRFKIVPKPVISPEDEKTRLDGYLVSDIRDCLVHIEEDTLKRFRKAQNKPEFNPSAGFGGNLWFARRGMFNLSLWLIFINMTAVPLMAAAYGWMHKGSHSLPYDTSYAFLFLIIMLALEFYPLGKIADRMFWKHTKKILDVHGCKDRAEKGDPDLKKKLAEDGGLSSANSLAILALDLLLVFFCKQVTTAIFLYFSYTR